MTQSFSAGAPSAPIAYFSMEIGVNPAVPTYAGGLGVLAGDTLRAAADMGIPMVGVTLLHRQGYFRQRLGVGGEQSESPALWSPEEFLEPLPHLVPVTMEGRQVWMRAWRYVVRGVSRHTVPVYFLDTALAENTPWDQSLTGQLYGGDGRYRLCQEAILGLGGVAMLRALGYRTIQAYHMNEGHAALLALALLEEQTWGRRVGTATEGDVEAVRQRCVFTTHTPVRSGHDQFALDLARQVLGEERLDVLEVCKCFLDRTLNMTFLGAFFSRYVNGVTLRHGQITKAMLSYPVDAITNGVDAVTWTSQAFQRLFDRRIPEWRRDNLYLRYSVGIPLEEVRGAHTEAKEEMLEEVDARTGVRLDPALMTIGFGRRVALYKRADFLFSDLDRLKEIARRIGPLQVIYGGKAHPRDEPGKALIRHVFEAAAALRDTVRVLYLEEYDMRLARYLCAGVDLWLNTPQMPLEASGTSGMKAALNGVPSLSTLDGWWVEGHVEGVTGWAIGDGWETGSDFIKEAASLYDKLEQVIVPMFYRQPLAYAEVMRSAIALNGSFFNTQRMLSQYVANAYLPKVGDSSR